MSGPVTAMPSVGDSWTAIWRFALAHGTTTRRFKDAMQRAGYQIIMVAGEPQVRQADVEAYIRSLQLQQQPNGLQKRPAQTHSDRSPQQEPPGTLSGLLEAQARELEQLRAKVEQLLAAKGAV